MKEFYKTYFLTLAHPYRIHDYYKHGIPLPGRETDVEPLKNLSLPETILLSWPWAILGQLVQLVFIYFLTTFVLSPIQNQDVALDWLGQFFPNYQFIFSAVQILLFPIITLATTYILLCVIGLWSFIPVEDDNRWGELLDIFAISNTASFFLFIPFFGQAVYLFALPFFTYVGLRKRWGLGRSWSIFLIATPLVTITLLSGMFAAFLGLFFIF